MGLAAAARPRARGGLAGAEDTRPGPPECRRCERPRGGPRCLFRPHGGSRQAPRREEGEWPQLPGAERRNALGRCTAPPPGVLRDPHAAAARSQQRRSGAQCVPGDSEVPRREQRGPGSSGPQGSVRVWGRGWPWKKLTLVRRGDTARSHGGRRAKMSGERSRGQRGRRGAALFGEGGRARGVRGGGVPGLL